MSKKLILSVLGVALLIRLVGIDHGFPYIYHPDEPTVTRSALGIRFDNNPHHFDWPHLYIYLNYFVYMVFAKLRDLMTLSGLRTSLIKVVPIIYNDNLIFYLLTRIFSAILGAFTIIPLYLWVKKLINKSAGLWSSVLLALAPLHVRNSHYALIDVPMLFFLAWSLFFATFSPVLSGLFLGFSASIKYNGIFGALFISLYYLLTRRKLSDFVKTGVYTVVGFVLGTPFSVFDFKTFIRTDGPQGALWQFTNLGKVDFVSQIVQFFEAITIKVSDDLGYGAVVLLGIAVILTIRNLLTKKPVDKVVVVTLLTFLLLTFYISGMEKNRSHYYMVVYPYFFLVVGWVLSLVLAKLKQTVLKTVMISLVLLPSLVLSIWNIVDLENKSSKIFYGGDIKENNHEITD